MIDWAKIFIKNRTIDKYLFVLRDNIPTIPQPNVWALFWWGIELWESPGEALKRELKEEIEIPVFNIHHIHSKKVTRTCNNKKHKITAHYYKGETDAADISQIKFHEWQKIAFFSLSEISQMNNVSQWIKYLLNKGLIRS